MMGGFVNIFEELKLAFPTWARIFFLVFMLLFFFILINLNNAIMNAAYVDSVKEAEERALVIEIEE